MTSAKKFLSVALCLVFALSVLTIGVSAVSPDAATPCNVKVIGNDIIVYWDQPFDDGSSIDYYTIGYLKDGEQAYSSGVVDSSTLYNTFSNLAPGEYKFAIVANASLLNVEHATITVTIKDLSGFALFFTDIFSSLAINYPSLAPTVISIYEGIAGIFGIL